MMFDIDKFSGKSLEISLANALEGAALSKMAVNSAKMLVLGLRLMGATEHQIKIIGADFIFRFVSSGVMLPDEVVGVFGAQAPATSSGLTTVAGEKQSVAARQIDLVSNLHSHLTKTARRDSQWADRSRQLISNILDEGLTISLPVWGEIMKCLATGDVRVVDFRDYESLLKLSPKPQLLRFIREAKPVFFDMLGKTSGDLELADLNRLRLLAVAIRFSSLENASRQEMVSEIRAALGERKINDLLEAALSEAVGWDGESNPVVSPEVARELKDHFLKAADEQEGLEAA